MFGNVSNAGWFGTCFIIILLHLVTAERNDNGETKRYDGTNNALCGFLFNGERIYSKYKEMCKTKSPMVGPFEGRSSSNTEDYNNEEKYNINPKFRAAMDFYNPDNDQTRSENEENVGTLQYLLEALRIKNLLRKIEQADSESASQISYKRSFGQERNMKDSKNRRGNEHVIEHPLYLI